MRLAMRIQAILYAALSLSLLPACQTERPRATAISQAAGLPDHDPALAHRLVAEGALLLDVRTPDEYADRHIDGALNFPVDELSSRADDLAKLSGNDRKKPIVVYCGTGKRAARAKALLTSQGYEAVTNLGGIDDWARD